MSKEAYVELLQKIVPKSTRFGEFVELDVTNSEHYACIEEHFGGRENLHSNFSQINTALQNMRKTQHTPPLRTAPIQDGINNSIEILEVFLSNTSLEAPEIVSLTEIARKIFITITVLQDNKTISITPKFGYNTMCVHSKVEVVNFSPAAGKNLQIFVHATWENTTGVIRSIVGSDMKANSDFLIDDVITNITVNDPILKHTTPADDYINVCYARVPIPSENIDYTYNEGRSQGNQIVYLDGGGKVTLKDGVSLQAISLQNCGLIMNSENKGSIFFRPAERDFLNQWFSTDADGFTWSLPKEWLNTIQESAIAGSRPYGYALNVTFSVLSEGAVTPDYTFMVSSYDDGNPRSSYKLIPYIKLFWGCFLAGTQITMSDNTKKAIEEIRQGDIVKTPHGSAKVVTFWEGDESTVYVIETKCGKVIRVSKGHPLLTNNGIKRIEEIVSPDKLIMEDSSLGEILHSYSYNYACKIYNISIEDTEHIIYADGFLAGDMVSQNAIPEKDEIKETMDDLSAKQAVAFAKLWEF